MEPKQLYSGGKPFVPETAAGTTSATDTHGLTGGKETTVQSLLDAIIDRIINRLLERGDIAEWAKKAEKPVYTAGEVGADTAGSAQTALATAKDYADATYRQATGYTDERIAGLVNGAPETLDTLKEIADAMAENEDVVAALQEAIGSRASDVELQAHMSNGTVHITESEREAWFGAVAQCAGLAASFSDGCDRLVEGCRKQGVTPASNSPADIVSAIETIATNKYNAGITAADARTNVNSANYKSGYNAGVAAAKKGNAAAAQVLKGYTFTNASSVGATGSMPNNGALNWSGSNTTKTVAAGYYSGGTLDSRPSYNAGVTAADARANVNSANYKAGYNAGVTAADARANSSSANYKAGYNAGVAAADARTNVNSANYKAGYNAGVAALSSKASVILTVAGENGGERRNETTYTIKYGQTFEDVSHFGNHGFYLNVSKWT